MAIKTISTTFSTKGNTDIIDITGRVGAELSATGFKEGGATLFVGGSTAGLTTMEYEPGQLHDLKALFESLIPRSAAYEHNHLKINSCCWVPGSRLSLSISISIHAQEN